MWPSNTTCAAFVAACLTLGITEANAAEQDGDDIFLLVLPAIIAEIQSRLTFAVDRASEIGSTFGESGGSLELTGDNGTTSTLGVPADTVESATAFSVANVEAIGNLPVGLTPIAAVQLGPSGQQFSFAPRISFSLPTRSGLPALGFLANDDGTSFSFIPLEGSTLEAAAISDVSVGFDLTHFSVAGVAEVAPGTVLPGPPDQGFLETKVKHDIARRIRELLEAGDPITASDTILASMIDQWQNDPENGWLTQATAELQSIPDINNFTRLFHLLGELMRLERMADLLGMENALPDNHATLNEIFANYGNAIHESCDIDTLGAHKKLIGLLRPASLLGLDFDEADFECSFEVTLTPEFQSTELGQSVTVGYSILAQDGTSISGPIEELRGISGAPGAVNGTLSDDTGSALTFTPDGFGVGTVEVELGSGPTARAEILIAPQLTGPYTVTGSGTASQCEFPDDEGPGGGSGSVVLTSQSIQSASPGALTLAVSGSGDIVTSADLTVSYTTISFRFASGTITGQVTYSYTEVDEDENGEPAIFVTIGSGSVNGTVTTEEIGTDIAASFNGGDNFCASVTGSGTMFSGSTKLRGNVIWSRSERGLQ
jgi:hypothetical protein